MNEKLLPKSEDINLQGKAHGIELYNEEINGCSSEHHLLDFRLMLDLKKNVLFFFKDKKKLWYNFVSILLFQQKRALSDGN